MTVSSLIKLIGTLSPSEKRHFKLQSKMQSGNKEYLLLFDLIEEARHVNALQLKAAFKERSPQGSWDNTCTYLGKMLIELLVSAKNEKDVFFTLLHDLQEMKILKERSLDEEALKLARKLQQKAARYQLPWIEYYCYRFELNHHTDNNFVTMGDEDLVRMQMKGKEVLRSLNHIHDHYSLYELLKFRLIHTGRVVSEEGKKKMTDLMLSEMVLVAGKSKSFTSQKLHLLFQSFFFTDLGDYHSGLKSFYQLNELMEKNESFLDNPPLDYFSALTGIIDSLRVLHKETEITYYLSKLTRLDQPLYPEFFRYLVKKTVCCHQILVLLNSDQWKEAGDFVASIPADVFENYGLVDEEKQTELYFYCSLVYFKLGEWQKAHLLIRDIMNQLKLSQPLLVTKAIRLLNILIYFEKQEALHLEYEVRAYKRYFNQQKLLKTEKLLFRILGAAAANKRLRLAQAARNKLLVETGMLSKDPYEQQLLKYFDFAGWMNELIRR